MPLSWDEVPGCDPAAFTLRTVPALFQQRGDPHAAIDQAVGSLESLLALSAQQEAEGQGDAPWPPHFAKQEGEPDRVAPSRKKGTRRVRLPVITLAESSDKAAALAGLERWKARHAEVVAMLAPEDILVDTMRGRSSTWTRIRVNLQHVPEAQRPAQEALDPDDAPVS
jgi:hypothetical protein